MGNLSSYIFSDVDCRIGWSFGAWESPSLQLQGDRTSSWKDMQGGTGSGPRIFGWKMPRQQFGVALQGLVYFLMYWNDTWHSDSWGSFSFCWGVEGSLIINTSISLCFITSHCLNSILPLLSWSCGSMMEESWSSSLIGPNHPPGSSREWQLASCCCMLGLWC